MIRLGRNRGAYLGETIDLDDILGATLAAAHRHGWQHHSLEVIPGRVLPVLTRPPASIEPAPASDATDTPWAPRIYISAGIHGDEPAGPLAIRDLLESDAFPSRAWLWVCPCLNPSGFRRHTRESAEGVDLNRDYRHLRTPEIRAHVGWLQRQPAFDLTLCLHEDWESNGFYLYELNPDHRPSPAQAMIDAVRDVCPIDLSPLIEGRPAQDGIIRPTLDPASRPEWPEAFYLLQNHTRLSYTLEAPSDFDLAVRVAALAAATRAALRPEFAPAPRPETPPPTPPSRETDFGASHQR